MGIETYFEKFGKRIDLNILSKRRGKEDIQIRLAFLCGAIIGSVNNPCLSEQLLDYINEYQRVYAVATEFGIDIKETDNQTNAALGNAGYEFQV